MSTAHAWQSRQAGDPKTAEEILVVQAGSSRSVDNANDAPPTALEGTSAAFFYALLPSQLRDGDGHQSEGFGAWLAA
jgi:hypothetical protein